MADNKMVNTAVFHKRDSYIVESLAAFYRASDVSAKAPATKRLPCRGYRASDVTPKVDELAITSNLTKALKRNSGSISSTKLTKPRQTTLCKRLSFNQDHQRNSPSISSSSSSQTNLCKQLSWNRSFDSSNSSSLTIMTMSSTMTPTPTSSVNSISIEMSETSEFDESVCSDVSDESELSQSLSAQLIQRHIIQQYSLNPAIYFDRAAMTESNGKVIAVSSTPLKAGLIHEWTLEVYIHCISTIYSYVNMMIYH